jgi:hypothetical protein
LYYNPIKKSTHIRGYSTHAQSNSRTAEEGSTHQHNSTNTNTNNKDDKDGIHSVFGGSLQKYLNKFFLKVHPDLFNQFPEVQSVNQESLKTLNSLLDIAKSGSESDLNGLPYQVTLRFFLLRSGPTAGSAQKDVFREIKVVLTDLVGFDSDTKEPSVQRLEKKIENGLFDLFKQADIDVPRITVERREFRKWIDKDEYSKVGFLNEVRECIL